MKTRAHGYWGKARVS
jgi:hypothetical protein